jgi:diketogulonate reductase-like aldo/keto reductase
MNFSMIYGTAWKKERTQELVSLALSKGFIAIDTANQLKHYTEPLVGEALAQHLKKGFQRDNFYIQTKFTSVDGQDHRLPYEKNAKISVQVEQSIESSLKHLQTDYVDSYLLHGPYNYPGLGEEDWEVWSAIEKVYERGKTKSIGVSNVNHLQLAELLEKATIKPKVVQNRCFAQTGWDFHVRKICETHQIMYQGFSLLTANPFVMEFPEVIKMAKSFNCTPAQVIFVFARQMGMIPLTGTTQAKHMEEDLRSKEIELANSDLEFILQCGLE